MKVQIAEARLRGDIETRGSSFRRMVSPPGHPSHPRRVQPFLARATALALCVLNFLRSRFPPRAGASRVPEILPVATTLSSHDVIIILLTRLVRP